MPQSSSDRNHEYILSIQRALFAFQMIEEALKIVIGLSYEMIAKSAPQPVVFQFEVASINNAPLGKLTKMFAAVSANTQLASNLRKIKEWRNLCAHRGFAYEFMSRQSERPVSVQDISDVKLATSTATDLVKGLGDELRILREAHRAMFESSSRTNGT